MATVYTFTEREGMLNESLRILQHLIRTHKTIERYRDELVESEASETPWLGIETATQAMLDQLDYMRDRIVEILGTDLNFTYEDEIYPVSTRDFSSVAIDVNNGSSKATLTANDGTPFYVFDAGDTIEISGAENPLHDGQYTVDSVTAPGYVVMTLTTVMPSTDNAADTQMHIKLVAR